MKMSEGQRCEMLLSNLFPDTAWLFLPQHLPRFGAQRLQDEPQPWEQWGELCKSARGHTPSRASKLRCPGSKPQPQNPLGDAVPPHRPRAKRNPWTTFLPRAGGEAMLAANVWRTGGLLFLLPLESPVPGGRGILAGFPGAGRAAQASWAVGDVLPEPLLLQATASLARVLGPFCPSDRHSVCPRRGRRRGGWWIKPNPAVGGEEGGSCGAALSRARGW